MNQSDYTKLLAKAVQKELDIVLEQFENDFAKTIKRISTLDIEVEGFSTVATGGKEIQNTLADLLNQQFKQQKTPLNQQINQIGGSLINKVFSGFFGNNVQGTSFNPSAERPMRLSKSQSAADIFSILTRNGKNG